MNQNIAFIWKKKRHVKIKANAALDFAISM